MKFGAQGSVLELLVVDAIIAILAGVLRLAREDQGGGGLLHERPHSLAWPGSCIPATLRHLAINSDPHVKTTPRFSKGDNPDHGQMVEHGPQNTNESYLVDDNMRCGKLICGGERSCCPRPLSVAVRALPGLEPSQPAIG